MENLSSSMVLMLFLDAFSSHSGHTYELLFHSQKIILSSPYTFTSFMIKLLSILRSFCTSTPLSLKLLFGVGTHFNINSVIFPSMFLRFTGFIKFPPGTGYILLPNIFLPQFLLYTRRILT